MHVMHWPEKAGVFCGFALLLTVPDMVVYDVARSTCPILPVGKVQDSQHVCCLKTPVLT